MVKIMNMVVNNTAVARPSLIVEIVGPAGAGKTTLVQALSQRAKQIRTGVDPQKLRYIPFFLHNTLVFLPTFLHYYRHSRWFTWEETRSMVYLKAWHHILAHQRPYSSSVTLLDHGPIFRLALLRAFGPEVTTSQVYERWWNGVFNQWAATLDMIIWLDAPDLILMERIQTRNRWHRVQQKSEQAAYEFLERYRTSYEQIISKLTAKGGPRVLCFDTNQEALDQMVDKVLAAFDLKPNQS